MEIEFSEFINKTKSKKKYKEIEKEDPELTRCSEELKDEETVQKSKKKSSGSEAIKTFCRIRPTDTKNDIFKVKEDSEGRTLLVNCDPAMLKKLNAVPTFTFTRIFDETSKQIEVFESTCKGLVEDLLTKKKSGLIFTYGMTNAGKTFTVIGSQSDPGILPMSLKYLYQQLEGGVNEGNVYCNFVEIYNEEVFDLLATDTKNKYFKKKIPVKENCKRVFFLPDVTYTKISTLEDFKTALNLGILKKVHASTSLNQNSSRSHTIFKIIMKPESPDEDEVSLSIVDLAGSERANRTEAAGKELQEACKINQSLSVLGKCMEALRYNSVYSSKKIVPFRESKLTMLFQEYFQGDQNIIMITNINPRREDFEETVRALNYSCVAREIKPIKSKIIVNPIKKQIKLTNQAVGAGNIINNKGSDIEVTDSPMNDNFMYRDNLTAATELNFLKSEIEKLKEEFFMIKTKTANRESLQEGEEKDNTEEVENKTEHRGSNQDTTSTLSNFAVKSGHSGLSSHSESSMTQFQSHINQMSQKIQRLQMMSMINPSNMDYSNQINNNPYSMVFPFNQMAMNPMAMFNPFNSMNPFIPVDNMYQRTEFAPSEYNSGNLQQGVDFECVPPGMGSFNLVFINSKFNDFCMGPKKKRPGQKRKKKDDELTVINETQPEIDLKDIFEDSSVVIREVEKPGEEISNVVNCEGEKVQEQESIREVALEKKKKKKAKGSQEKGSKQTEKKKKKKKPKKPKVVTPPRETEIIFQAEERTGHALEEEVTESPEKLIKTEKTSQKLIKDIPLGEEIEVLEPAHLQQETEIQALINNSKERILITPSIKPISAMEYSEYFIN